MNKLLILISALLLVGCSSYRPIADLKASKNANHFQEDRLVAREKAAEMLKNRILNHPDGIFYLIDKNTTTVIPMELEKLEKEKKNR